MNSRTETEGRFNYLPLGETAAPAKNEISNVFQLDVSDSRLEWISVNRSFIKFVLLLLLIAPMRSSNVRISHLFSAHNISQMID